MAVTGNAHGGTYAVRTGASYAGVDQVVTGLSPNTSYTLRAWVKNASSGNTTYLGVKSFGGTETNENTTSTGYQELTVTFTTGASNTTADIYIWKNGGSAYAYADDFTLTEN